MIAIFAALAIAAAVARVTKLRDLLRLLVLTPSMLAACSADLPLSSDVVVTCATDADCPNGLVCLNMARCVDTGRVDFAGPTPTLPRALSVVRDNDPVAFLWQAVPGALGYVLTLTTDDTSPRLVALENVSGTSTELPVGPGTYRWSVTADITDASVVPVTLLFGVIHDALNVYCAPSDTCTLDPAVVELGTVERPFRSIARAINAAVAQAGIEVHVAKREIPYADPVSLLSGLTIQGGYARDFSTRDGRTAIATSGSSLIIAGVADASLAHFDFTNTNQDGLTSTVARVIEASESVVLTDVGFHATLLGDDVVRVENGRDISGPRIVDSLIEGNHEVEVPDVQPVFLVNVQRLGALRLENTTIRARWPTTNNTLYGVEMVDGHVSLADCTLDLNGQGVIIGIHAPTIDQQPPQTVRIVRSTIMLSGDPLKSATSFFGIEIFGVTGLLIDRSTVALRNVDFASGISLSGTKNTPVLTNNLIVLDAIAQSGQGIFVDTISDSLIADSTIVLGGSAADELGLHLNGNGFARVVNNAFVSRATGCTGTFCKSAVLTSVAASPQALAGNAFIGYPAACAYVEDGACVALNTSTAPTNPFIAGNIQFATASAAGIAALPGSDGLFATADDEFRLVTGALAARGYDVMSNACKDGVNTSPNPACGGVTLDRDSKPRPNPPAIGAYEP